MEVLHPPVSSDRALALVGPTPTEVSKSQADQVLVNAPVGRASRDDPFPSDHDDMPLSW